MEVTLQSRCTSTASFPADALDKLAFQVVIGKDGLIGGWVGDGFIILQEVVPIDKPQAVATWWL